MSRSGNFMGLRSGEGGVGAACVEFYVEGASQAVLLSTGRDFSAIDSWPMW